MRSGANSPGQQSAGGAVSPGSTLMKNPRLGRPLGIADFPQGGTGYRWSTSDNGTTWQNAAGPPAPPGGRHAERKFSFNPQKEDAKKHTSAIVLYITALWARASRQNTGGASTRHPRGTPSAGKARSLGMPNFQVAPFGWKGILDTTREPETAASVGTAFLGLQI